MRLQRLHLERFGKFTDKVFDFGEAPSGQPDFHIFYGPNEAGKTTFMESYLRLLYGFKAREPYDFKHKRANLRVSGVLETDNGPSPLTRLPQRRDNLLNAHGEPVSETAASSVLGGLDEDQYRSLLCLDDVSLEKGGEEIVSSQGDIGRLLFSVATGVADLSTILDQLEQESKDLYLKNGTKSKFALLKAQHSKIVAQIKEQDVSGPAFVQLQTDFEKARAAEAELRAELRKGTEEKQSLRALLEALPLQADLLQIDQELRPLATLPPVLPVDQETLVNLAKEQALKQAEIDRFKASIKAKQEERAAIQHQPEMLSLAKTLADNQGLRDRCGPAANDLPHRREQRDDKLQAMQDLLAGLGLSAAADPQDFVFDTATLASLRSKHKAVEDAKIALAAAASEEQQAEERAEQAQRALKAFAPENPQTQTLRSLFSAGSATRISSDFAKAQAGLLQAKLAADTSLASLSFGGTTFDALPVLTLTAEGAAKLARELDAAKAKEVSTEEALIHAQNNVAALRSKIAALETSKALVPQSALDSKRREREALWAEHLQSLSQPSAEKFERALREDDQQTAQRLSQSQDVAEVAQIRLRLFEAEAEEAANERTFGAATKRRLDVQEQVQSYLKALGLPECLGADILADWTRKAEAAQGFVQTHHSALQAAKPALDLAKDLQSKLRLALDLSEAPLDHLIDVSQSLLATEDKNDAERRALIETLDNRKKELKTRAARTADLKLVFGKAEVDWQDAATQTLGSIGQGLDFPQAFDVLQDVSTLNVQRADVQRQIDAMERDAKAFELALEPLRGNRPQLGAVAAFDALVQETRQAAEDEKSRQALAVEIKNAQEGLEQAQVALSAMGKQIMLWAEDFAPDLKIDGVEDLRAAVRQGEMAQGLRARREALKKSLLSKLGKASLGEVQALLQDKTAPDLQSRVTELTQDIERLKDDHSAAISARTEAKIELDRVTGEADVAKLVAERQTLELEMESVIQKVAQLQLGQQLAHEGIRRYRDAHRSGMLTAAEAAFSELTQGAYNRLTTEIEGPNETLMALQASDGASKRANDLSKGTRFQLYLALRAAAYEQLSSRGTTLPFICDDIFETFDEDRTRAACLLLRRIGQTGQAIYLTHHRHVVDLAKEVCGDDVRVHNI